MLSMSAAKSAREKRLSRITISLSPLLYGELYKLKAGIANTIETQKNHQKNIKTRININSRKGFIDQIISKSLL